MDKLWLLVFVAVLVWSAINPADYFTWFLEVLPAIIGLLVLLATRKSFPLTPLVYVLILVHCIILMVGGHYTYAEVPLFDWIRDSFGLARNNYDKVGHFAQGFVPAMVAREVLIRKQVVLVRSGGQKAMIVGDVLHCVAQVSEPTWCAGVDIDSGRAVCELAHDARDRRHGQKVEFVSDAIHADRIDRRVGENNLVGALGGRVTVVAGLDILCKLPA